MEKTLNKPQTEPCTIHDVVCSVYNRRPWNWGKRKPVEVAISGVIALNLN